MSSDDDFENICNVTIGDSRCIQDKDRCTKHNKRKNNENNEEEKDEICGKD